MQKHTTKRTHGHDGKDRMVIISTLWDTDGRAIEDTSPLDTRKVFEDQVRSFSDSVGEGKITDLKDSKEYLAYVKESLGGAPDQHSVLDEDAQGFRWYTRATGDGGSRILQIVPALYGETEDEVKKDVPAARERALEHSAAEGFNRLLGAMLGGTAPGDLDEFEAPPPGMFDDLDDDDGF